jgi:hypothetical protein
LAVSAATATRASCQPASAPASRCRAASRAARLPPNRSTSQPAWTPACSVVASGAGGWLLPRAADSEPSAFGSKAAPAATRLARACAMRVPAAATVGLADCAAAIRSISSGSLNCCHQRVRSPSVPSCGRGAYHWGGAPASIAWGGRGTAHADRANAAANAAALAMWWRIFFMESFPDWVLGTRCSRGLRAAPRGANPQAYHPARAAVAGRLLTETQGPGC